MIVRNKSKILQNITPTCLSNPLSIASIILSKYISIIRGARITKNSTISKLWYIRKQISSVKVKNIPIIQILKNVVNLKMKLMTWFILVKSFFMLYLANSGISKFAQEVIIIHGNIIIGMVIPINESILR